MARRGRAAYETPYSLRADEQTPWMLGSTQVGTAQAAAPGRGPSEALLEFRIHPWRLLIASTMLSVALAAITEALQQGFELATVAPGESLSWAIFRSKNISEQIDDLNSYSGNAASALGALWTFVLQLIVYVLVLALLPALVIDNSPMWARLALLAITGGVGWLATQGFVATNVQLKPMEIIPVLSFDDLNGFDGELMNTFQNYTPLSGNAFSSPQSTTSTLLRSAIAGAYPREVAGCNRFDEGDHDVSVSYGFSASDWLRYLLPSGSTDTTSLTLAMNSSVVSSSELPMSQTKATSLAIYALEMTESFFGVQSNVNETRDQALWSKFANQATENTKGLINELQLLVGSTFTDQKKYFQHFSTDESTAEITQTLLSDAITFDAITLEIPLKRNFFSRSITAELSNTTDGNSSTLVYSSVLVNPTEGEDAVYEMAVWEDCNYYGCMLTGLDEVNSQGVVYYPESQVLAVRICLDSSGNEDPLETISGCQYGRSLDSFLVFSIASRIEGDAMTIDSEDETISRLRKLQADMSAESSQTGSSTSETPTSSSISEDNATTPTPTTVAPHEIPGGDPSTPSPKESSTVTITAANSSPTPSSTIVTPAVPSNTSAESTTVTPSPSPKPAPTVAPHDIPGGDANKTTPTVTPTSVKITSDTPTPSVPEVKTPTPTTETPISTTLAPVKIIPDTPPPSVPEVTTVTPTTDTPISTTQVPESTTQTPEITTQAPQPSVDIVSDLPSSSPSTGASGSDTSSSDSERSSKTYTLNADASTQLASDLIRKAYLKNARKIYTITVGRMSWTLEDLAHRFGARCNITYNRDCQGLSFELTNSSLQLVVGHQYLPLANLRDFSGPSYLWTPLAKIKRDAGFGGDFAAQKGFKETNWPEDINGTACKSSREEYLMSTLDNHLYSQHSFQPAYTSSIMWLFQYGTANEVINLDENRQSLSFVSNIVRNRVVLSTPSNSSFITYVASGLVVVLSLVVSLMAWRRSGVRPERPVLVRTVAEAMLQDNRYPPVFLTCYVHSTQDTDVINRGSIFGSLSDEPKSLQEFQIHGLQLSSRDTQDCQWLSDAPNE